MTSISFSDQSSNLTNAGTGVWRKDANDFLVRATNNLLSSIYRPPATDEERHDAYDAAPFEVDEGWTWVEAEKRLKRAYDEGGFPLWARAAMREVEAEARVERVRRQREMDEKAVGAVRGS